jgi:hypothetical protein
LLIPPELACPQALAPFLRHAPVPVLVRSCLEWLVAQADLNTLFNQTAQDQYTLELTLDFLVDLMLDVACGIQPSAHAALRTRRAQIDISRQAFYAKLARMELPISAAVVERLADLAEVVMMHCGFTGAEPIPGYQARVLDGTVLGGRTEHRLAPLRSMRAAGLTGHALAVYAPATRIVKQVVLDEDAYTQERAMLPQVRVRDGEVWLADRNFCVREFLFRVRRAGSAFIVRWHAQCPYEACGPVLPAAGTAQGATEQQVRLTDPESGDVMMARRIVLPLATRTRNGDAELILLTDLPPVVSADATCDAYRQRWQIETHFQRLTQQLHGEPAGLDRPRAALFAFAMATTTGNALAMVTAALQAAHGEQAVQELSYYYFVLEVSSTWKGMAVAVPDADWAFVRDAPPGTLAIWLLAVARQVDMTYFRRNRRGPKKPPPKKAPANGHTHVSNKRVIDEALYTPIKQH